jgi:ATPase (AAA+ superfamily)-like protein
MVEGRDRRVVGVEVKLASIITDRDVRHLRWLKQELGERVTDLVVLTTGPHAFRRADGIAVVPLGLLAP